MSRFGDWFRRQLDALDSGVDAPGLGLARSDSVITIDQWVEMLTQFSYQGMRYTLPGAAQEEIGTSYRSLGSGAYKSSGVIFACILNRMLVFSEARFQFRRLRSGRPGDLFGNAALAQLERPWPGGTTGDLLTRMILHVDLAGNAFVVRRRDALRVLRPDWVTMILGSYSDASVKAWDVDADVLGYIYEPGGPGSSRPAETFLANDVAHFAPLPDPDAQYRGMSWLTPIVREIMGDKAATEHKLAFFSNGATPNTVVKLNTTDLDKYNEFVELFKAEHEGIDNAYKTIFLAMGADVQVVGANLRQLEFTQTQGAGETRIAAAAGVPPVIVGLSEGLQAATYSNYGQARRRFADATLRPLWRNVAGSLARVVDVPDDAELWYDDRDIPFLREDEQERAAIQSTQAAAIRTLTDGGFTPESTVDAVVAGDFKLLQHSGKLSVQLQPIDGEPSDDGEGDDDEPAAGSNGRAESRELLAQLDSSTKETS